MLNCIHLSCQDYSSPEKHLAAMKNTLFMRRALESECQSVGDIWKNITNMVFDANDVKIDVEQSIITIRLQNFSFVRRLLLVSLD
jgi:hypothetical protein